MRHPKNIRRGDQSDKSCVGAATLPSSLGFATGVCIWPLDYCQLIEDIPRYNLANQEFITVDTAMSKLCNDLLEPTELDDGCGRSRCCRLS